MGKRLETTPRSKVRAALRQLFLRSRERAKAIQRDKYTCQVCGRKQSKAKGREQKVEVHHQDGVCNWQEVFELIYKNLLCHPDGMATMCPECHEKNNKKPRSE